MNKKSYPNIEFGLHPKNPYNIKRWIEAMNNLYQQAKIIGYNNAFNQITNKWDEMEKLDFKTWLKFYEQDNHLKYKQAQYIPLDALKAALPPAYSPRDLQVNEDEQTENPVIVKKQIVPDKKSLDFLIKSLLSRLTAAENIATKSNVRDALDKAGINIKEWFTLLHRLKLEIQSAPIRTATASDLIEDIIVKNANTASNKLTKDFLISIAQLGTVPMASTPMSANPADNAMGQQPLAQSSNPLPNSDIPGSTVESPEDAVASFLKNLSGIKDTGDTDDMLKSDDESDLIVEAQAVPNPLTQPQQNEVIEQEPQADIEVAEEGSRLEPEMDPDASTTLKDDLFDKALEGITVKDIINRMNSIINIFRQRRISNELSIIDLMLQKAGLASFVPEMSEIQRSVLESNNYSLSRAEEILSRLSGVMITPLSQEIDKEMTEPAKINPENQLVVQRLQQQQNQEEELKKQKKLKKQQEEAAKLNQPIVAPNMQQELTGPAQIVTPTAPPAPPPQAPVIQPTQPQQIR